MTAGVMIKGVNGGVQVNEQIVAWGMSATGTITLVDDGMTHPQPLVVGVINVSGGFPVIAIRPRGGKAVGITYSAGSGGSYTYHLMAQSSSAVVVDYWVFDNASQSIKDPTLNDVGVKAWDENGVLTFDAAMPHMRLMGAMTPGMPTAPIGSDQSTSATFTVPATKSYAVVIGTIGHIATNFDTGNYNSGSPSTPPDVPVMPENPDAEPPVGATWREQILESYLGMVSFDGGVFEAGMTRFEYWRGWYPMDAAERLTRSGSPTFTVVDVTGYGGGAGGGVPVITVNLNSYSVSVSGAAGATTISPPVTASASGGTGPYTYLWAYDSGSTAVVNFDATNANPFRTQSPTQPGNTTREARWRVKATDSLGNSGWSEPITFTHTATSGPDYTPDAITPFNLLQVSSNDPDVAWSVGARQITGINQPINLRFERYGYSGNLSALYVDVFSGASASGPWTHHGYFTAHAGGTQYLDVNGVMNGTWFYYSVHAVTSSGLRSGACTLMVWNLSEPGGSVKLSDVNNNTFKVDADDNYNIAPDVTPNPISLSNQSVITDDWQGYTPGTFFQITGINQPITIRITRGTTTDSAGRSGTRRLIIGKSTNGGASYAETNMGALSAPIDFTANNGDWFFLMGYFDTTAGRGTSSWTTTVTNATTGANMGSITVSGTVDADDNYNVTPVDDFTMNAVSLTTQSIVSDDWQVSKGFGFTVSGINKTIFLQWTMSSYNSNGADTLLDVYRNGVFVYRTGGGNGHWAGLSVNNGDQIWVEHYLNTTAGKRVATYVVTMTNETQYQNFGSYSVSLTVDNDQNYNVTPLAVNVANGYSYEHPYVGSGQFYGIYANPNPTVSGGLAPYTAKWTWIGGQSLTVSNLNVLNPTFAYEAMTSWARYSEYQLEVTDANGTKVYGGFTADWAAGDQG